MLTLAVVYNAPKFAEGRLEPLKIIDRPTLICAVHTSLMDNHHYRIIYGNIAYCVFMLVIPLVTLTVLNVRLMAALKDVNQKRREMQSARQQQDNNVTLVLIVVVIVFSVCQFPALVTQLSWNFLPDSARLCGGFQFYFSRISNALVIANSAVNFIIYCRFNKRFRSILRQLIRGRSAASGSTGSFGGVSARRHPLTSSVTATTRCSTVGNATAMTLRFNGRRCRNSTSGLFKTPVTGVKMSMTNIATLPTTATAVPASRPVDDVDAADNVKCDRDGIACTSL